MAVLQNIYLFLNSWQTLAAGILAILAAWYTVRGTLRAAKLQVEAAENAARFQVEAVERIERGRREAIIHRAAAAAEIVRQVANDKIALISNGGGLNPNSRHEIVSFNLPLLDALHVDAGALDAALLAQYLEMCKQITAVGTNEWNASPQNLPSQFAKIANAATLLIELAVAKV